MTEADEQRRSRNQRETGTRDHLVAATRSCVRERGLAGTTSRDIAAAAGANLGAITYYFGSKDDLVAHALFDELDRQLRPALDLLQSDGDQVGVMLAAIERLITDFEANRRDSPIYLEALVAATRGGEFAKTARRLLRSVQGRLHDRLEELHGLGVVPNWVDPNAMASLIIAVANGIALQVSIDPRGPGHRDIATQFASLLISARQDDR